MRLAIFDYRVLGIATLAAAIGVTVALQAPMLPVEKKIACSAPAGLEKFAHPLGHAGRKLAENKPLTIAAIGSSSTAGAGASSPAASYPSRLAEELNARFPMRAITVKNHGVGGTEVKDMLAKFDNDVAGEKPDLVLWQLGTNSLLRDTMFSDAASLIEHGVRKLRALPADLVLINPQYAPKVLAKAEAGLMLEVISNAAEYANVNVFDRFSVMRHWHVTEKIPFGTFLSPDELHMNDWSYDCVAKLLGSAIAEAATRPAQTLVTAQPRN